MKRIYFAALVAFVFHGCGGDATPPPLHPLDATGVICSYDDPDPCVVGRMPSPIRVYRARQRPAAPAATESTP